MLIPIFGELVTSIGLIMCTYFDRAPMEVAGVTETLFPGITGELFLPILLSYNYLKMINPFQADGLQCSWACSATWPMSRQRRIERYASAL